MAERWSDEFIGRAIGLYLEHKSTYVVARMLGVTPEGIGNWLRRRGVPRFPQKTSPEVEGEILKLYQGGRPSTEVGKVLGVSHNLVLRVVKRLGGTVRPKKRTYTLTEDYFETIDTEGKAYWLGFLAADGNVSRANSQVSCVLARRDEGHLVKLQSCVGSDGKIYRGINTDPSGKHNDFSGINLNSKKMKTDLAKYGIVPNKGGTVSPWQGPRDLLHHYWRGAWDGDGALYTTRAKPPRPPTWNLDFVGNELMVRGFASLMRAEVGGKFRVYKAKNIYATRCRGIALVQEALAVLYEGSTIWLDRKKEKRGECFAIKPRWKRARLRS